MPTTTVGTSLRADYAADKGGTLTALADLQTMDFVIGSAPLFVPFAAADSNDTDWTTVTTSDLWLPEWVITYSSAPWKLRAFIEAYMVAGSSLWRIGIGATYSAGTTSVSNTTPYAITGPEIMSLPTGSTRVAVTVKIQMKSTGGNRIYIRSQDMTWQVGA